MYHSSIVRSKSAAAQSRYNSCAVALEPQDCLYLLGVANWKSGVRRTAKFTLKHVFKFSISDANLNLLDCRFLNLVSVLKSFVCKYSNILGVLMWGLVIFEVVSSQ